MSYSYLVYIAAFGALVVAFLWLRDARIFWRTGLPGYRRRAYRGILYTALSLFGLAVVTFGQDFLGLGLMLLALFLQGREEREKVWDGESPIERFFGTSWRRDDKDSK
jgi:hypothetical protein